MAHMNEREWAAFAASKNLNPVTGGEVHPEPEPTNSAGDETITLRDVQILMNAMKDVTRKMEQIQLTVIIAAVLVMITVLFR